MKRRRFLQFASAAATAAIVPRSVLGGPRHIAPSEKLNIACIGVGGQGEYSVNGLSKQNLVAFADVDDSRAAPTFKKYPDVKRYRDYRRMLDELHTKLDAVTVCTPDHMHFHPAYMAMQYDLNVYLEKPLAHDLWEIRTLTELAEKKKLATQLGAQRHAMANMHRVVELIKSGAIGDVSEVHSWEGGSRGMPEFPTGSPPVPKTLDWDLWLGPAKRRPYSPAFCPYNWRFWWDYGSGETGNWGCHILDIPFWALDLKYPGKVTASGPPVDPQRSPKSMIVQYEFPARDELPALTLHWYHVDKGPAILRKLGISLKGANNLFIGTKGMLLCGFDTRALLPKDKFADFESPKPFIPDSPGFHNEFVAACKGGKPATCNFEYAGPLAETVILGNVAYRAGGFDWDAKALKTVGNSAAQALIREEFPKGWTVEV